MSNPGPASTTTTATLGQGSPDTVGTNASSLAGFHGAAVIQANSIASVSTSALVAVSGAYGFATEAQATALIADVNSILAALRGKGVIAT